MPLDPVVAGLFAKAARAGQPALSAGTPNEAREMVAAQTVALGRGPDLPVVRDFAVPGRKGEIPVRLYAPSPDPAGLLVYFHGGGWVIGRLDDHDSPLRAMSARSGCAILAVDYRLAPEHPFPAGLEDAVDALSWAIAHGRDLVPDLRGVLVGGDSAGANLATVAALAEEASGKVAAQILIYPVVDAKFDTETYRAFGRDHGLSRNDMIWFFDHYAPEPLHNDARIAPLRRADLARSAPAAIVTAEFDVLRHEGEAYAERLADAGVPVAFRRADGMPHGFIRLRNVVSRADDEVTAIAAKIREAAEGGAPGWMDGRTLRRTTR